MTGIKTPLGFFPAVMSNRRRGTLRWLPESSSFVNAHLLVIIVLTLGSTAADDPCPCSVCPCYCPCMDFKALRIAVAIHYPVNTPSSAGTLLLAGARQAAVDRNLQLEVFTPGGDLSFQVAEADAFVQSAIQSGVHAIVTTLLYEEYLPSLQAARDAGISLYIVGGTSTSLLPSLRSDRPTLLDRLLSQGPAVTAVGADESATAAQIAERLQREGVRNLACLRGGDGNVLFADRCAMLAAAFESQNLTARVYRPASSYVQMMLVLSDLQDSGPAHEEGGKLRANETAFVVNDHGMYLLLREVMVADASSLAAARVVVYAPSVNAFDDASRGQVPVTLVQQGFYSQGYTGVALAAYERQTGQMLVADVAAPPVFLESGQVTEQDVRDEMCRRDGYPVCGAPGVPSVSPNGCRCFPRESVRVKVLSSLPRTRETAANFRQGFLDGVRDVPGAILDWAGTSDNVISPAIALTAVERALADANWTALVSLDNFLAQLSPPLKAKMRELGWSRGNRTFWLGADRDERVPISSVLDGYGADGYFGPGKDTWAALGAHARASLGGSRTQLTTGPLHVLPKWDMVLDGFVAGFLERRAVYPPAFWDWPSTPATRAQGWVQFTDNRTGAPAGGPPSELGPVVGVLMRENVLGGSDPLNRSAAVAGVGGDAPKGWASAGGPQGAGGIDGVVASDNATSSDNLTQRQAGGTRRRALLQAVGTSADASMSVFLSRNGTESGTEGTPVVAFDPGSLLADAIQAVEDGSSQLSGPLSDVNAGEGTLSGSSQGKVPSLKDGGTASGGKKAGVNSVAPGLLPGDGDGDNTFLHLRQGPLTFDGQDFSVELARLLGWGFDSLALVPMTAVAVMDTLAVLEAQAAAVGRSTRMQAVVCRSSSFRAFAYPDSMAGGARHDACADGQHNLASYLTFMAAALYQQTHEKTFHRQDVSTGRVVTRAASATAGADAGAGAGAVGLRWQQRQQRRADCELFESERGTHMGNDGMYFPVCNYSAGCGNPGSPCSGRGVCQFPTAEENAAAAPSLLHPATGRCVCDPGWQGDLCETREWARGGRARRRAAWLAPWLGGAFLATMLALAAWVVVRRLRPKPATAAVNKQHPPREGQVAAVVFTDIQGSTTLWEWDAHMMSRCIDIHHKVLRTLLTTYHGYESNTEGDAFELVFHDAADAVHFMLDVQTHLLQPDLLLLSAGGGAHATLRATPMGHKSPHMDAAALLSQGPLSPEPLASGRTAAGAADVDAGGGSNSSSRGGSRQHRVNTGSSSPMSVQHERLGGWPAKLLAHELGKQVMTEDGTVLFRGLRVRMGLHVGVPDASYQHANGRQRYTGAVVDMAKAIGDAPMQGGQLLLSMDAWRALGGRRPDLPPFVVHHMGEILLNKDLPPVQLMEVLPETLRRRAPFAPLRHLAQLTPSFFSAPASGSYVMGTDPTDPIVMMFTFVGGASQLKAHPEFKGAAALLVGYVRSLLGRHRGYECEEKEGNFLLAFADPVDAAAFSQELQAGAMALPWPEDLLQEVAAAEVLQPTPHGSPQEVAPRGDNFVFRGLRVKCGMYIGVPTKCLPHATTGRAAYFGPMVNRAARVAGAAADGQTLCNIELALAVRARAGDEHKSLQFTTLGKFALRGIAEPMELCQVSSVETGGRLFPRTRSTKQAGLELTSSQNSVEMILQLAGGPSSEDVLNNHSSRGRAAQDAKRPASPLEGIRDADEERKTSGSNNWPIHITIGI